MPENKNLTEVADALANKYDADIFGYFGDVQKPEDDWIYRVLAKRKKRKNIILVLATRGGDPHVAYRISRCLQMAYKSERVPVSGIPGARDQGTPGVFTVLVNSRCKSAGTILALGASRIWMTHNAEFGPIDVQLRKPDEVGERTSGLTPMGAIGALQNYSVSMFKNHFSHLRFDEDLLFSTKMAAEQDAMEFSDMFVILGNYYIDRNETFFYHLSSELPVAAAEPTGGGASESEPLSTEGSPNAEKTANGQGVRRARRARSAPRPPARSDTDAEKVLRIHAQETGNG